MDTFLLRNQVEIPVIGFGTYKTTEGEDTAIIRQAIEAGYRYLDTASIYGNEQAVGRAVRESGVPRKDIFLCSKVWRERMGYATTREDFETSCKNMETDYLDLYLMHWPRPKDMQADWKPLVLETWKAMEELYREGRVRAIGVSNFLPHHLYYLMENTSLMPVVNQIEFHPGYIQKTTVDFCRSQGIQVAAWSPMGRARVMKEPLLVEMADKYQVSVAQLCIRFALQCGVLPLPKSSSPERMRQNLQVFDFEIERDDMYGILTLPQLGWSGEHPDRERVPAQV